MEKVYDILFLWDGVIYLVKDTKCSWKFHTGHGAGSFVASTNNKDVRLSRKLSKIQALKYCIVLELDRSFL